MSPRTKQIGVVLGLMSMTFFVSWPFWKWFYLKSVQASMRDRTQALVDDNPQLKPAWDVAVEDGVLTLPEAKIILIAGGEKIDSVE